MVRKIKSEEYIKRLDNMTAVESREYLDRVGDWLSVGAQLLAKRGETFEARLQNVLQVSIAWNDAECQAFEKGAVLLSALVGTADTWLPEMLYAKSAKRAIKQMFQLLWAADAETGTVAGAADNGRRTPVADDPGTVTGKAAVAGTEKVTQPVGGKTADKTGVRMQAGAAKDALLQPAGVAGSGDGLVPARPKHIDQYVHLLPKKTQEHAAQYGELMRDFDASREKLRLLMDAPDASASEREAWAKKVTRLDNTIGAINRELDEGWALLVKQGRVVVDDLGMAHVLPADGEPEPAELTSEQKARRRELRKWLVDTRRGNGDTREEYVRKWKEKFGEYLTIEGDAAFQDEKVMEAAKHYGIESASLNNNE